MADLNGYSKKAGLYAPVSSSRSPINTLRRNPWMVAAVFWVFVSVYPAYLYWLTPAALLSSSRKPKATVTETVAVPAIHKTALPGALPTDDFNLDRVSDAINTFRNFKQSPDCQLSSLELHGPFEPLCKDKDSLMEAMSTGGRLGFDAPYSPRGCDMRWFSVEEMCAIMKKFDKIFIIGDSMMRNLAVAFHVFLRTDLVNGARATWLEEPEGVSCRCRGPFETSKCAFHSVVSTRVAFREDPDSVFCEREGFGGIEFNAMLEFPIKKEDIFGFTKHLSKKRPKKPYAFIFGHGLWNDLDKEKTFAWVDQAIGGITEAAPYLVDEGAFFPRLFLTPNAAGVNKPYLFHARQGNLAVTQFEHAVAPFVKQRGFDHLGTYNMSIQAYNPDGTHGGMKVNLVKAMMVMNWLNALTIPAWYGNGKD